MAKFKVNIKKPTGGEIAPTKEVHSDDLKIEQRPDVVNGEDRAYSVDALDVLDKDYLDTIAFFEEPVKILLHAASDENAATAFPVWVNGKPAEMFQRNKWDEIGYLPVNKPIVVKRKVLSVIIGAKISQIKTDHADSNSGQEYIENRVKTFTKPLNAFSVLEDKNPRGQIWLTEQMNRNM